MIDEWNSYRGRRSLLMDQDPVGGRSALATATEHSTAERIIRTNMIFLIIGTS